MAWFSPDNCGILRRKHDGGYPSRQFRHFGFRPINGRVICSVVFKRDTSGDLSVSVVQVRKNRRGGVSIAYQRRARAHTMGAQRREVSNRLDHVGFSLTI